MKYFRFKLIALFAVLATITACSMEDDADNDYCYSSFYTGINEVTGPETTTVDEPIEIMATFNISNGCGEFNRFVATTNYPKQIVALVDYSGCTCTEVLQTVTEPYTFTASEPGEYVLKFIKPDETFITKTITVTE